MRKLLLRWLRKLEQRLMTEEDRVMPTIKLEFNDKGEIVFSTKK